MSIILKGIDMPKASNEDCMAVIRSNGKVEVWQTGMKEFEAQAIQIPTPHGRIVDLKDIRYCAFSSDGKTREIQFLLETQVDALPTILEAEE